MTKCLPDGTWHEKNLNTTTAEHTHTAFSCTLQMIRAAHLRLGPPPPSLFERVASLTVAPACPSKLASHIKRET
eukprot:1680127-Amphidinium_carterae.1